MDCTNLVELSNNVIFKMIFSQLEGILKLINDCLPVTVLKVEFSFSLREVSGVNRRSLCLKVLLNRQQLFRNVGTCAVSFTIRDFVITNDAG